MKLQQICTVYKKTEWSRTGETTFHQPCIKGVRMARTDLHTGRIVEDHGDRWVVVAPPVEVPGEVMDMRPDRILGVQIVKVVIYRKSLDKREFMGSYPENIWATLYKGEPVIAATYTLYNVRVVE